MERTTWWTEEVSASASAARAVEPELVGEGRGGAFSGEEDEASGLGEPKREKRPRRERSEGRSFSCCGAGGASEAVGSVGGAGDGARTGVGEGGASEEE